MTGRHVDAVRPGAARPHAAAAEEVTAFGEAKRHHAGTHRSRPPADTWAWLAPQLPRYGITRVADVTGLDDIGIPVFMAVRPAARTLSVSQGKGLTPLLARVSAAMESVELWHAEHAVAETAATPARAWDGLPYAGEELDAVPEGSLWHDDLPVEWMFGEGLLTGARIPVPFDCVRLDYRHRARWSPPVFRPSSNGLAGGNTVTEATVHALCEVAERDTAHLLGRTAPDRRQRLDLDTVDDGPCRWLLDRLAAARVDVEVSYSAGRTGVPCFQALGRSEVVPQRFAGWGCHPDPRVALSRALTEAAQSRLTAITGSRDDDETPFRAAVPHPSRASSAAPAEAAGPRVAWTALADSSAPTLEGDMAGLAAQIAGATGREPVRVVLASPTGVPVVKVIAPGLRFDDAWGNVASGAAR